MREKPILFNTRMVKALLDGRKTQTRRLIKPASVGLLYEDGWPVTNLPVEPGDILWVRETWAKDVGRYMYKANYSDTEKFYMNGREIRMTWHPSIHMPKDAARIFLRVKSVRAGRLQDYFDASCAHAEGIIIDRPHSCQEAVDEFIKLWNSTIKPADIPRYGWDANPWVWVISFEVMNK